MGVLPSLLGVGPFDDLALERKHGVDDALGVCNDGALADGEVEGEVTLAGAVAAAAQPIEGDGKLEARRALRVAGLVVEDGAVFDAREDGGELRLGHAEPLLEAVVRQRVHVGEELGHAVAHHRVVPSRRDVAVRVRQRHVAHQAAYLLAQGLRPPRILLHGHRKPPDDAVEVGK